MRRVRGVLLFGLAPAVVVAGAVFLIGVASTPPRFVAHAAFVINWKAMPSVPRDETAENVRNNWRKNIISEVTSLPQSEQKISDLLDRANRFNGSQTDKAVMIPKMQKWLRVTLANQTNDCDCFVIEMRDTEPNRAEAVVKYVLQDSVSQLNTEARMGSGIAALRSEANVDNIAAREDELKRELQNLKQNNSWEGREAIEAELRELEWKHAEAGLGLFMNAGDALFASPVKIVQEAHVEKQNTQHGLRVLLAAFCLGGVAGVAGLLMRRGILTITAPKAVASSAPPIIKPTGSVNDTPPVISQHQGAKPPLLPPPLPPATHQ